MAPSSFPIKDVLEKHCTYQESNLSGDSAAHDAHLKSVAEAFSRMSTEKRGADYYPDPLETLDIERATLPFLLILAARISLTTTNKDKSTYPAALKPGGKLWQQAANVLTKGDAVAARYAGDSWQTVVETIARSAAQSSEKNHPPGTAVAIAAAGILRIDPSGGTLTSSHLELVRASLATKSYAAAKPVLDCEIHSLPSTTPRPDDVALNANHYSSNAYMTVADKLTDKVTLTDILEYYLLGAMVYIGLGDWARATHLLEHVLCMPSKDQGHAHALQVEAYKKWVLTSLLAHGRPVGLPKAASGGAMRTVKSLAKEYEAVAEAFKGAKGKKVAAEVYEARGEFQDAGNEGLVRNVVARHRQLAVSKLASTYSVVPFSMIARHVDMANDEAEAYVRGLVQQGLVEASIQQEGSEPMLRFGGAGSAHKTEQRVRAELETQTRRIKELSEQVAEADRRLGLSKEWIEYTVKRRKSKGQAAVEGPGEEEAMDMSFGGPASDEDEESVMADVG